MEIIGKIKLINETQTFGTSGFRKRELVVTTDEQYPQMILVEFVQDKCDLLDNYQVGQNVKIGINLRGKEWINPEGVAKYFNSINGWFIDELKEAPKEAVPPSGFEKAEPITGKDNDDMPF